MQKALSTRAGGHVSLSGAMGELLFKRRALLFSQ